METSNPSQETAYPGKSSPVREDGPSSERRSPDLFDDAGNVMDSAFVVDDETTQNRFLQTDFANVAATSLRATPVCCCLSK